MYLPNFKIKSIFTLVGSEKRSTMSYVIVICLDLYDNNIFDILPFNNN